MSFYSIHYLNLSPILFKQISMHYQKNKKGFTDTFSIGSPSFLVAFLGFPLYISQVEFFLRNKYL
jgi:hypothetical protein